MSANSATLQCNLGSAPEVYRARRRELELVRASRLQSEAKLREIIDGAVPGWIPWLYARSVIPLAVIGVPLALALTQSSFHWFAREWVVIGGLAPFLVALLPWLVLWAKSVPWTYLRAIGGELRPGPPLPDGRAACDSCAPAPRTVQFEGLTPNGRAFMSQLCDGVAFAVWAVLTSDCGR